MRLTRVAAIAAAAVMATSLVACSSGSSGDSGSSAQSGSGTGTITIWAHQGQDSENAAIQAAVSGFNSSQSQVKATLRLLSGDTYTTTVTNTPADKLPDVLEMDGPTLASYVYNDKLSPLTGFVSQKTIDNATPGSIAEGTDGGKLYGLAMYDSAMGLWGNKKMLDAAGVKYPTSFDSAWTPDEFTAALKKLAAKSSSGKALDISEGSLNGEWGTYAFAPLLWSAGGNLIKDNKASGVMDSAASVKAVSDIASWKQYVDPNADGNAVTKGRVALGWGGHWEYPTYSKALGSNLLDLPLPNFGQGAKAGAGSWTWGIGAATKNGKAAGAFMDYLMNDKNITAMTTANGAPPATKTAFAADKLYQSGGGLALWGQQLSKACPAAQITTSCIAVYRPVTAGYPTVTSKFGAALAAVYGGAPAQATLTTAAKAIDQTYSDNDNYQ